MRRDGTRFPVEFRTAPIMEEGKLIGAVIVFQDITERKRAEANLALVKDVLEVLNRRGQRRSLIAETLRVIRRASGFDAVGLRLREGDDCPYFEHDGFAEEFLARGELPLRARWRRSHPPQQRGPRHARMHLRPGPLRADRPQHGVLHQGRKLLDESVQRDPRAS